MAGEVVWVMRFDPFFIGDSRAGVCTTPERYARRNC